MLPAFNSTTYYRILSGGREELARGKGCVIVEYIDGLMLTNTSDSSDEALQVANDQVEIAAERDDIAAVYLILNEDGKTRLYGCAVESSWEILPTRIFARPRLRASMLAA
jgi:hypothetical protein